MKLRVTIDTDECSFDSENESSYTNGVVSIDVDGVYRAYYGSPSYFVTFNDVEVIECKHESRERFDCNKCGDCGKEVGINEVKVNE